MVSFPNAKINLGLSILQKRDDGFHDIESCFYPIGWCDGLEIIPAKELRFTASGITIPGDESSNLCLKVFHAVNKIKNIPPVHIHLHKAIPIGAGMGGGSSDAAFTLKMLNEMFDLNFSEEKMEEIVRPLGSDCAFFIKNKPTIAFEKGDKFRSCALDLKGKFLVAVYPAIHVSTKEAYQGVVPAVPTKSVSSIISNSLDGWRNVLSNDFESSVFKIYPELQEIKNELYALGAQYASMTGSGSAVFGIFDQDIPLNSVFKANFKVWSGIMT